VATKNVFTCKADDPLTVATDLMASQNLRRLPVVDDGERVIGWLTLSDVSRQLLVGSDIVQNALRDMTDKIAGQ
jgi:CBS domain-containing protein